MKSETLGKDTSEAEVTNISKHGIWLLLSEKELFLPFEDFPWFKNASVSAIYNVELLNQNHLYWPDLDIDLTRESIAHPDRFPLRLLWLKVKTPKPTCFVIMPISDVDGYDVGHFGRVYEFIIKPACKNTGFKPVRADEVQVTNYIVVDILRRILDADMVVCDLSGRNANVLYELGIRQAFNRPVTLIRDSRTPTIFDIQGLRDLEYDETLSRHRS